MRVEDTIPEIGTVFDWDIDEILTRESLDSAFYRDWDDMLKCKRQDEHYSAVLESIRQWGFLRPLTASSDLSGTILVFGDGHHRLAAAIELGMTTVPVEVTDYGTILEDSGSWDSSAGVEKVRELGYC